MIFMKKFDEENIKTKMRCPVCDKNIYLQTKPKKLKWHWFHRRFYLLFEYRFVCLNCGSVDVVSNSLSGLVDKLTAEEEIK